MSPGLNLCPSSHQPTWPCLGQGISCFTGIDIKGPLATGDKCYRATRNPEQTTVPKQRQHTNSHTVWETHNSRRPKNNTMSASNHTSREVAVEIVVQPPSIVGVSRRLIPPVVARTGDPQLIYLFMNNARHVYATSMLTSSTGQDSSAALNGNWNANSQLVTSSGGGGGSGSSSSSSRHSGSQWLYFVFDPVCVRVPGTYTFSVVVSALNTTEGSSVVVGGRTTDLVTVVNQATRPERPSKNRSGRYRHWFALLTMCLGSSERQILRQLETAGIYRP